MQFTCVTQYIGSFGFAFDADAETFIVQTSIEKLMLTTFLTLLCAFFPLSSTDLILAEGNSSSLSINQGTTFITGPYLDGNGISNVTTQISTHAYLPCRVSRREPYLLGYFFALLKLLLAKWAFS